MREAAKACRACDLYKHATQTVFGEGPARAQIMLVGEQPGDAEDLAGHPFVGPAGKLLDRALAEAGIDRRLVYVTNVVKHFKFEPRGKWRIHKKPNSTEIGACRQWLDTEIALVKPRVLVCLGATAVQAAARALTKVGRESTLIATGGGSDANALVASGYEAVLLANGTEANHTPEELVSAGAMIEMLEICEAAIEVAADAEAS